MAKFGCLINLHEYEVFKEEDVKLAGTDIVVKKVIISKCKHCGKLKINELSLVTYNYKYE